MILFTVVIVSCAFAFMLFVFYCVWSKKKHRYIYGVRAFQKLIKFYTGWEAVPE